MARVHAVLLIGLLVATALAGCTGDDGGDAAPTPPTETPPTGGSPTTPTGPTTPTPDDTTTPPPARADVVVTDAGAVQGPFEKSWTLDVPDAGYQAALIQFNLTGAQAGAPVTARVYLSVSGPDGTPLKSGTVGLGGGNALEYAFSPGELPAGSYTVSAMAEPQQGGVPGVPSFGIGNYELYAIVDY